MFVIQYFLEKNKFEAYLEKCQYLLECSSHSSLFYFIMLFLSIFYSWNKNSTSDNKITEIKYIINNLDNCNFLKYIFYLIIFFFIFRERWREGEREGEKHQSVAASYSSPTGDLVCDPGTCSGWESNLQPFGSQTRTQSTEPHQPGHGWL